MKNCRSGADTMMDVARKQTDICSALKAERVSKLMHEECDQADADAAFRAVVKELCTSYGMAPDDKPYFYLKRMLSAKSAPDIQMIAELARVCDEHGIQEGEDPATFLDSKCREVARLTEQLEVTQHKLADAVSDAESEYDQDDCVTECMSQSIVHDIHVNTSKCVAELVESGEKEHALTRKLLLAVFVLTFASLFVSAL